MHKLECSAMCSYGENWCPSETVRLVARIIVKQVRTSLMEVHDSILVYIVQLGPQMVRREISLNMESCESRRRLLVMKTVLSSIHYPYIIHVYRFFTTRHNKTSNWREDAIQIPHKRFVSLK